MLASSTIVFSFLFYDIGKENNLIQREMGVDLSVVQSLCFFEHYLCPFTTGMLLVATSVPCG